MVGFRPARHNGGDAFAKFFSPLLWIALIAWMMAGPMRSGWPAAGDDALPLNLEQGLILRIASGVESDRAADVRRARMATLFVPASQTPSPFLAPGSFAASWSGYLEIEERGEYTFEAQGKGCFELFIDETQVIGANGENLPATSGPVKLNRARPHRILARLLRRDASSDAWVRLFWSSDRIYREPIPPRAFLHDADDPELGSFRILHQGRELWATRGCIHCHAAAKGRIATNAMPELAMDAPSFKGIGSRLQQNWMAHWVENPNAIRPGARMPRLLHGPKTKQRAADVAAYLATLIGEDPAQEAARPGGALKRGKALYEGLGCIGCHTLSGSNSEGPDEFDRIVQDYADAKWKSGALKEFLLKPNRHFAWNRMPDFKLSTEEAAALEAYLRSIGNRELDPCTAPQPGDSARGKELVRSLGCLNCHADHPEDLGNTASAPTLAAMDDAVWEHGCLSTDSAGRGQAPDFGFDASQLEALRAFAKTGFESLNRKVPSRFALRQVEALRCAACHSFDGEDEVWLILLDESEDAAFSIGEMAEILGKTDLADKQDRPIMTWFGEKLRTEWMARFIGGQIIGKPRAGLLARMPSFAAYASDLATGLAQEHGLSGSARREPPAWNEEKAALGEKLIGADGGLSCVSCHAVGDQPAQGGAALRTIHFDIITARLRREFYDRWMFDPQRIEPSTMMPLYIDDEGRTGITTWGEDDPVLQFGAIWDYLLKLNQARQPD